MATIINGMGKVGIRIAVGASSGGGGTSYLLDTYGGAAAAYSLRKLSSTYSGSAIRVRRSSDNTEQNIGFDGSGNLDTTALTAFVGAGNGFVTTWYDQSGSGRNAIQTTASQQPQIVTSGVVNTLNNKPSLLWSDTFDKFMTNNLAISTNSITISAVYSSKNYSNFTKLISIGSDQPNNGLAYLPFAGVSQYDWVSNDFVFFGSGYNNSNPPRIVSNGQVHPNNIQTYGFLNANNTNTNMYLNGNEITYRVQQTGNINLGNGFIRLGNSDIYAQQFRGNMQEIIVYPSNQSSNRSGFNSNINTYYSIYPTDADAAAFVSAAGITDSTQMSAVNTLVTSLKSAGIWSKMKAIYPFVGGTASSHKFNLKDPRDLDAAYRLVFNGGWTHSSTGALLNGSNGYADTKFIPNGNVSLNSVHLSYYSRNAATGYQSEIGVYTSSPDNGLFLSYNYIGGNYKGLNSPSTNVGTKFEPSTGFLLASRITSTNEKYYWKGSMIDSLSKNSSTLNTQSIFMGAHRVNGGASNYSSKETAFASIGDGLSDAEASALYTAVQAFQTTLGRQVA